MLIFPGCDSSLPDGSGCVGGFSCALLAAEDHQLEAENRLPTHRCRGSQLETHQNTTVTLRVRVF